ncbi:MAG: GmrSD restriction endonuclease domain-containing protein, partial [Agrobacterium tumefaciens]
FLPAIQRPYVWGPEQLVALFDSLMKGYPISSFLLWDVAPENELNWQIYKFAEHFRYGEVHNEIAGTNGRKLTLVLDGQQRLTSLLIGLRGSFTIKSRGRRWDNPDAWQRKMLYIDLLVDPALIPQSEGSDDNIEHPFGFELFDHPPQSGAANLWMKVGDILNYPALDQFNEYVEKTLGRLPATRDWTIAEIAKKNLNRLYQMIWADKIVSYYTETNQDYDRVLGIFVRANDGGTKLSKSDLMLSMISSKWTDISAREEIYNFVETLNNRLDRKNDVNKDFVMKACLLLSDLDHVYQVKNFTNRNLEIMRINWPRIQQSLKRTFQLVNSFGIDRENLTSLNALLPIAYYLHKIDIDLLGATTTFHVMNAERIRRWLIGALLNRVFGGTSDSTIGAAKNTITASLPHSKNFPIIDLNAALSRQIKRPSYLTSETLGSIMELQYGNKPMFLLLSLLYDGKSWGATTHHIDHIFPQGRLDRKHLIKNSIPISKIEQLLSCTNRVGNLQLLASAENLEKSNATFEDWIRTRDHSFLDKHLIPEDEHLWSIMMLPQFVAEREKRIMQKLASLQGDPEADVKQPQQ